MNISDIINKAQKNDNKSQKALFMWSHELLMNVALRYVHDRAGAEDVVQNAFIRIFNGLKSFSYINDAATIGWMKRITATEAIRFLKSSDRWKEIADGQRKAYSPSHDTLLNDDLAVMLKALPQNQQLVFNLFAIEGYSHKEIADQMSIAESSSRSLLTRARANLQVQFQNTTSHERA